ncbi:hypothetical protein C7B65_07535 [Phormidesmis priestleyi ULC007]|uniref:Uncharacterized protein n=1 Tax=Phormidesmis priestleyi ULC007 TaxID=1920490 RepID=A0A2T1DIJ2_9CYAN|nr:hypothetical protein [Phormidesmis priestleyi]PSB20292.1 hypothetical protein C7B65_07535 [Phormidesmis priestleyi ULC007]PZO50161.1 MAG: hypothetical protein DCF14_12165 [Phormidesmis priestleyi]
MWERSLQELSAAVKARAMWGRSPSMQETCKLTSELNLNPGGKIPLTHHHERIIQKDSTYLPDLE